MTFSFAPYPSLQTKTLLVTGANSGIGYDAALAYAGQGARVILACRSQERGAAARDRILTAHPNAEVELRALDLADLASIAAFAEGVLADHTALHGLINNAGIMAIPLARTADGFEMQFGTNHLGHFALTGHLLPLLGRTPDSRIVNVASLAHRFGRMRWHDPNWQKGYNKWLAYGQSKLANLLFTHGLTRRVGADGPLVVACHPGVAATNLATRSANNPFSRAIMRLSDSVLAQPSEAGAWPTLMATVAPLEPGDYIGPKGFAEFRGAPAKVRIKPHAQRDEDAARLWSLSEELTGVRYLS